MGSACGGGTRSVGRLGPGARRSGTSRGRVAARLSWRSRSRRSGARRWRARSEGSDGLRAGEKALKARCLALGISLSGSWGAIALVALGSALVGLDGLGGVGTSDTNTLGLAGHIGGVALVNAADQAGGRRVEAGSRGGGAGDGRVLLGKRKDDGGQSGDSKRVLHGYG